LDCHCCNGEANRFGRSSNRNRTVPRFHCVRCGKTFSEDQPRAGLRIGEAKLIQIAKLLVEGVGIRACAHLVDCYPHTVLRVLQVVGQKCAALLDSKVRNV
jgi:transposase-like protein